MNPVLLRNEGRKWVLAFLPLVSILATAVTGRWASGLLSLLTVRAGADRTHDKGARVGWVGLPRWDMSEEDSKRWSHSAGVPGGGEGSTERSSRMPSSLQAQVATSSLKSGLSELRGALKCEHTRFSRFHMKKRM